MKEYKLAILKFGGLKIKSFEEGVQIAEDAINEYVTKGWTLQQIVSLDTPGALPVGVFWREK